MPQKKIFLVFCFVFLANMAWSDDISHLNIMTESYPPYNYSENGTLTGLAVELLQVALKNSDLNTSDIQLLPWPRAYRYLLKNSDTMLFSMTRTEEREPLFKWAGPISATRVVLLAKKDSHIKIDSEDDLSNYSIGAIRDDIGDQTVKNFNNPDIKMVYPNSIDSLLKMLESERIHLLAYEQNVANWFIAKNGFDPSEFEIVSVLKEGYLYYAFNRSISNSLIRQVQDGVDQAKFTQIPGVPTTYDVLLNKYLPWLSQ